jgi:GTP diphosphokinase / guanosine-3',5'-bis(diphosphate) 3'-diphosphatase
MQISSLIRQIKSYIPNFNPKLLIKAHAFTKNAHTGQIRASGEPYHYHPFAVSMILAEMHLDQESIITAMLHDTVEDTSITLEDIKLEFGPNIAELVNGVTKLAKIKFQPDNIREGENFRKLLVAMSEDIRVLLVKLADRLHNMRTISFLSENKAKRIALETMEIYAPLAERIGMQKMKNELQDLSFSILHPEERQSIINRLEFLRVDEGSIVDKIESHIAKTMNDFGIKAKVVGREKTSYSIWHKMKQNNISFEQLSDIIAFRVIVGDVIECYHVLGIIHAAYHMVPGSFKDYISTPKDNGYQSLHTVVVGPDKQRIEIQIRTHEMHSINEWGVAAHWSYKQGVNVISNKIGGKQFRWVRELLKILENSESEEFIEHTKLEMYEDQVFCFTPKGEIVALPKGGTPVDFAYALHSDLGNTCVGAKVNGRLIPLRSKLANGDQVEIINSKNQVPSFSWEKFVVTGKAKSEIKRFIRTEQRKEYISLGKSIISKLFAAEGRELEETDIKNYLLLFQKKNIEDFYSSVGEGSITRDEISKIIKEGKQSKLSRLRDKFSLFKFSRKKKSDNAIPIKGMIPGMAIDFATCCYPIPGDQIIGIFDSGKGVIVHTADCEMLENFSETPEKWIELSWDKKDSSGEGMHVSRLKLTITNEHNSLATICSAIAKYGSNITNLKFTLRSQDFFEMLIDIEVMGTTHMSNIIASLRSKECVHHVERFKY